MVDGSAVFTGGRSYSVFQSTTILKWSPASRDEQYPLLCSLTSPRHWKCLGHPDMPSPSWKFQAHLLKAQSLHVALQRPWKNAPKPSQDAWRTILASRLQRYGLIGA